MSLVFAISPDESGMSKDDKGYSLGNTVRVFAEDLPAGIDLEAYAESGLEQMKKFDDYSLNEIENTRVKLAGVDARRVVYSYRLGGRRHQVSQWLTVKNQRGYSIECTVTPDTYDRYKARFEQIAASFKLD